MPRDHRRAEAADPTERRDTNGPRDGNLTRAILWMLLSGFGFTVAGACVRLAGDLPLYEKVFFRNVVGAALAWAIAARAGQRLFRRDGHNGLLLLRAVTGLSGMFCYFYAIDHLNLGDATVLNKLGPFFVIIFAVLLLKERLVRFAVPTLVGAFVGAALVIKPQLDFRLVPALVGMLSAVFTGLAGVVVRYMRTKESPYRIVFFFAVFGVLVSAPMLAFGYRQPTPAQLAALVGIGVGATIGQFALTISYHQAEASKVTIWGYAHVLFAFLAGLLIWGEHPAALSIAGAALIVAMALVNRLRIVTGPA